MAIKVMCDVGSNLYHRLLKDESTKIETLPMTLTVKEKNYLCYSDIRDVPNFTRTFFKMMRSGIKPSTTLVSPSVIIEEVIKTTAYGDNVIVITMSKNFSLTHAAAKMACEEVNKDAGKEVALVFDSLTGGFGEGLVALKAFELCKNEQSLENIKTQLDEYIKKVRTEFVVDDLKYLSNQGLFSYLTAKGHDLLSITPILHADDEGVIKIVSAARTFDRALKQLCDNVIKNIADKNSLVFISHCDATQKAEMCRRYLFDAGITNIEIDYHDLITGAHIGPGAVVIAYEGENRTYKNHNKNK